MFAGNSSLSPRDEVIFSFFLPSTVVNKELFVLLNSFFPPAIYWFIAAFIFYSELQNATPPKENRNVAELNSIRDVKDNRKAHKNSSDKRQMTFLEEFLGFVSAYRRMSRKKEKTANGHSASRLMAARRPRRILR